MANVKDAVRTNDNVTTASVATVDMKFEIVVIPVSDVDRAKGFYSNLGWRLDADYAAGDDFRVIQFTPPGSGCSVIFGKNVTAATPGYLSGRIRVAGPDPDHRSYRSFASFSDPDGNGWLLQEITIRLPGRIDSAATSFASVSDLASALRRAEGAHGEHEKRTGKRDENWPDWYAAHMVAEQAGTELPT